VERVIVWGVIAIGLLVVGIEARAKFGYDMTYNNISAKLKEIDESGKPDAALSTKDALEMASFGPSVSKLIESGPKNFGDRPERQKKLTWFSLFKTYEITLIMDEGGTVLELRTPNPPVEEKPELTPPEEIDESPGGGGPPPAHGEAGGSQAGGPGGGGGRGGRRPRGLTGLLSVEEVATELNLNEEQQTKIEELSQTLRAESSGMREIFSQLREADESEQAQLREQIDTLRAENEAKAKEALKEILNEEQMTRLQQINWQQTGPSALTTADAAEKLGLSEEQQQKLAELSDQRDAAIRDASREERQAVRDSYDEQFLAVLTEEQQTQWKSLLGESFEMPAPTRGGGRGGAGGGDSERPQRPQRPE
jgi:Spy/CpxP family protein refolding chaperone